MYGKDHGVKRFLKLIMFRMKLSSGTTIARNIFNLDKLKAVKLMGSFNCGLHNLVHLKLGLDHLQAKIFLDIFVQVKFTKLGFKCWKLKYKSMSTQYLQFMQTIGTIYTNAHKVF